MKKSDLVPDEICTECGVVIGPKNVASLWKDRIVCYACMRSLAKEQATRDWRNQPATEKQIAYLKSLGVKIPDAMTKERASLLVDQALYGLDETFAGPASPQTTSDPPGEPVARRELIIQCILCRKKKTILLVGRRDLDWELEPCEKCGKVSYKILKDTRPPHHDRVQCGYCGNVSVIGKGEFDPSRLCESCGKKGAYAMLRPGDEPPFPLRTLSETTVTAPVVIEKKDTRVGWWPWLRSVVRKRN
jgi:hypothetical protein